MWILVQSKWDHNMPLFFTVENSYIIHDKYASVLSVFQFPKNNFKKCSYLFFQKRQYGGYSHK